MSNNDVIGTLDQLITAQFNVSMEEIRGQSRVRNIATARHAWIYFAYKFTTYSLKELGVLLGNRDHGTIHASKDLFDDLIKYNTELRQRAKYIESYFVDAKTAELIAEKQLYTIEVTTEINRLIRQANNLAKDLTDTLILINMKVNNE